ncbi:hypothetical protein [Maricaulis sp.]|uniref:hypothetical protein n=1 Tax=Maricaulis sp. TaxID=1486257 RepID=UPI002B27BA98|nr:hypothetical protein [Maricaulis sp.]
MSIIRILVTVLAFSLGGCQLYQSALDRIIPDDARPMLAAAQALAIDGDTEPVAAHWHPDLDTSRLPTLLDNIATIKPTSPLSSISLVGAHRNMSASTGSASVSRLTVVYQLHWPETDLSLSLMLMRTGDAAWQITHFNLTEIDRSAAGPDGVDSWGLSRLLWVGLSMSIVAFVLITTISLYRFKRVKRRILWTIFILAGCFPVLAMDWATTAIWLEAPGVTSSETSVHLNLFSVRLFGASVTRDSLVDPWIIEAALPVGAILFWWRVMRGGPTRRFREDVRPR